MFLIQTRIGPSQIHGVGVFALEAVPAGTVVWRYDPAFDRIVTAEELAKLPAAFRAYLDAYAYPSTDLDGAILLCCDHAKFLNHSDWPNTAERPFTSVATRPIAEGDEITCDYGAFCVGWQGFDGATPSVDGEPKAFEVSSGGPAAAPDIHRAHGKSAWKMPSQTDSRPAALEQAK